MYYNQSIPYLLEVCIIEGFADLVITFNITCYLCYMDIHMFLVLTLPIGISNCYVL